MTLKNKKKMKKLTKSILLLMMACGEKVETALAQIVQDKKALVELLSPFCVGTDKRKKKAKNAHTKLHLRNAHTFFVTP